MNEWKHRDACDWLEPHDRCLCVAVGYHHFDWLSYSTDDLSNVWASGIFVLSRAPIQYDLFEYFTFHFEIQSTPRHLITIQHLSNWEWTELGWHETHTHFMSPNGFCFNYGMQLIGWHDGTHIHAGATKAADQHDTGDWTPDYRSRCRRI